MISGKKPVGYWTCDHFTYTTRSLSGSTCACSVASQLHVPTHFARHLCFPSPSPFHPPHPPLSLNPHRTVIRPHCCLQPDHVLIGHCLQTGVSVLGCAVQSSGFRVKSRGSATATRLLGRGLEHISRYGKNERWRERHSNGGEREGSGGAAGAPWR